MNTQSFLKRLIRTVVSPNERVRAHRKARQAIDICHALLSERGEVSGAALAREALSAYHTMPEAALPAFYDLLVSEFSPDPAQLTQACADYSAQPSSENLIRLQRTVEPPRQELFRRLNMTAGGTAALVVMRQQLQTALKDHPEWIGIDADLVHLFSSWFNRGFLSLERIDWHTPAIILEKLIQYEAVHEITGWRDLHRRLEADRRCFAYFHPALPDEPLIFIEVALTRGMSAAVQPLLDLGSPVSDPQAADTAIFYSITNCQKGLRGISFGNLLIKQVVQQLEREFPRIRTFATLSPIPGFRNWLASVSDQIAAAPGGRAVARELERLEQPEWYAQADPDARLQKTLMALCAYYLVHARAHSEPEDSVARFHLGNGARLERLNWLADVSKHGLRQSAGLMVNYLYQLDNVETNHEIYVKDHSVVASSILKKLARECPLPLPAGRR